jgi:Ras-related protein Rab-18
VYDVSRPDTLAHLEEQWMRELELYGTEMDAVRMVVANKVRGAGRYVHSMTVGDAGGRRHPPSCACHDPYTSRRQPQGQ